MSHLLFEWRFWSKRSEEHYSTLLFCLFKSSSINLIKDALWTSIVLLDGNSLGSDLFNRMSKKILDAIHSETQNRRRRLE